MSDITGKIIAYEDGELSNEDCIALFVELLGTGLINQLQGSYGCKAHGLIRGGFIVQVDGKWKRSDKELVE